MFVTRVFCDYVITLSTAISRDWCKIETIWNHFCAQSRLCPVDWCRCREGHVTILLPVWRFWPFRVIQTDGNRARVLSPIVRHGKIWDKGGPVLGTPALPASTPNHAECVKHALPVWERLRRECTWEIWLLGGSLYYRATRMHSVDYAVASCPSVRPSVCLSVRPSGVSPSVTRRYCV